MGDVCHNIQARPLNWRIEMKMMKLENLRQAARNTSARVVCGVLVAAPMVAQAADAAEDAVTAATAKITTYGGLLLGVVVAVWGIRKGISMWGSR